MPADLAPAASAAWMSDRPSWCVDRGVTLVAMTTCDLWLALARGDVTPDTKVWREGMPYWNRVASVPEFALALPDSPVWEPAPRSGTRRTDGLVAEKATETVHESATDAAAAAVSGTATEMEYGRIQAENGPVSDVRPAGSTADEGAMMEAASELVTPAPVVVEERETARPPARDRTRRLPKIDRATALSVAIGATLAVLALMLATTVPAPAPQATAHHVAAGAPVRGVELPVTAPVTAEKASADPAADAAPASAAGAASANASNAANEEKSRGPRSSDRGQRRARTGTGDRRQ